MMGRGDTSLTYLKKFFDPTTRYPCRANTHYTEAGPVIETPLSASQSLHDMLCQSWGGRCTGFPAVPSTWPDVSLDDFRTQGAFLVSAVRTAGTARFVRIRSLAGEPLRLRHDLTGGPVTAELDDGTPARTSTAQDGTLTIELAEGREVLLYVGERPELVIGPVAPGGAGRGLGVAVVGQPVVPPMPQALSGRCRAGLAVGGCRVRCRVRRSGGPDHGALVHDDHLAVGPQEQLGARVILGPGSPYGLAAVVDDEVAVVLEDGPVVLAEHHARPQRLVVLVVDHEVAVLLLGQPDPVRGPGLTDGQRAGSGDGRLRPYRNLGGFAFFGVFGLLADRGLEWLTVDGFFALGEGLACGFGGTAAGLCGGAEGLDSLGLAGAEGCSVE